MAKYTVIEGTPEEVMAEIRELPGDLREEVMMGVMAAVTSEIIDLSRATGKPDEWTVGQLNDAFGELPIKAEVRNGDIDFGYHAPDGTVTYMSELPDDDEGGFAGSGPVLHL